VVADKPVWDEYGLDEAARASYDDGKVQFKATGYRVRDTTAALAVFQWLKPVGWRTSDISELAVTNGTDTLFAKANYVILLEGHLPDSDKRDILYVQLARMELSALPLLAGYLPPDGLIDGSARFVTGPASLAKFEPRIQPSIAAFHLGAEAQLGRYRTPKGDLSLVIFNYPTPAIARDVTAKMLTVPGAIAKRTGPMVAVALSPDADAAERILARINYKASVSLNEPLNSGKNENPGDMLVSIFQLTGVLIGGIGACGLAIGLVQFLGRRYLGWGPAGGAMVRLQIDAEKQ
jgi:hypothetical protein